MLQREQKFNAFLRSKHENIHRKGCSDIKYHRHQLVFDVSDNTIVFGWMGVPVFDLIYTYTLGITATGEFGWWSNTGFCAFYSYPAWSLDNYPHPWQDDWCKYSIKLLSFELYWGAICLRYINKGVGGCCSYVRKVMGAIMSEIFWRRAPCKNKKKLNETNYTKCTNGLHIYFNTNIQQRRHEGQFP